MGAKLQSVWRAIVVCFFVTAGVDAQTPSVPWSSYAHGPQHTGLSTIGSQRLEQIKWSTPVDPVLQNTGGPLFIHYGTPLVTAANTVVIPERTSTSNTYQVEAFSGANGSLLYTLTTAYTPPPYNWIPVFGVTLSQGTRLYYPGPGGTVYYRDQPDSATGPSGQIAFYGNADYSANQAAFDTTVMISTPITADADGNIYFGFDVTGPNPDNLSSGLARIGADGTGSWIAASAAAEGDNAIVEVAMNCAPAVSNDGSTLYFAVSEGPVGQGVSGGYLVSIDSATLAPMARVRLIDPETQNAAIVPDIGSASPTVGPDNDVYYGVLESGETNNDDRGWLLHFDQTLTVSKTPGAFGWDDTASVVPANLVPSYTGASSYLLFTKYNNYMGIGPGGNGHNSIALLDPNAQMTDPITGATVMQEVITILGPTLSPPGNTNGSVREWCINSGAIDPFSAAALANSEDGTIYRWDFTSNSFTQKVPLTSGVSEAYTPTVIGADGTVYAINDAILFAVGQASNMTVTSTHSGNFAPGQMGVYTLTATNTGTSATNGTVTVTDILPAVFTAQSIGGQGWNCTQPEGPCSRGDSLAPGKSYQTLSLTVSASSAPSSVTNIVQVSADGAANSVNATASDPTGIVAPPALLSISKSHSGNFTQGQIGVTYTVTVSNAASAGPTSGPVTVTETVPQGMSLYSVQGKGWDCQTGSFSCSRSDPLPAGMSYSTITVTVNVANNASTPLTNQVNVSYGGWTSANATDSTIVISPCALTQDTSAGIADIQKVMNETLGIMQAADDLNQDGAVNLVDVQIVINAALQLGCSLSTIPLKLQHPQTRVTFWPAAERKAGSMSEHNFSRRHFFFGTLFAGAIPSGGFGSVPSLPALGHKPFSEKLNVAAIGCGPQGTVDMMAASHTENIVAVCDVDENRAASAHKRFEKATQYKDYRVMLDKEGKNIDAVTIGVPDFMHATVALACMERGKHVYVEKPLTSTVWEARLLHDAALKYRVATQMGNQGFSHESIRVTAEMIWSGAIGDVTEAHISTTPGTHPTGLQEPPPTAPVPAGLDWDLWQGRSEPRPFSDEYVPYNWRGFLDYGTGQIGNWATHCASPVQFALLLTAPTSVECVSQDGKSNITYPNRGVVRMEFPARENMPAVTVYYHDSAQSDDPDAYHVPGMENETILPRPNNLTEKGRPEGGAARGRGDAPSAGPAPAPVLTSGGPPRPRTSAGGPGVKVFGGPLSPARPGIFSGNGAVFIGTKGILATCDRGEGVHLLPAARWKDYVLPPELLTRSPGHMADWVRACKGGDPSCADFRITGPFAEWLALTMVAWRVPGKLEWDSRNLRFTNNKEANNYVRPHMRKGWELKV